MAPEIVRTIEAMRRRVREWRRAGEGVAVVPTMGALHEGHLELVRAARRALPRTIVTIFVNPKQFAPNSDFDRYPRNLDSDVAKLAPLGTELVFAPDVDEMYPQGFATTVTVGGLTTGLCGPHRPGHFEGVATVVTKLLLQAQADAAFFGEKDYQQLQVVKRLVADLDIPVRIVGVPTVREADGLALSSRNVYLSPAERQIAPRLYRILTEAAGELARGAAAAETMVRAKAALEAAGFEPVDYVEAVDATSLAPVARTAGPTRVAAAAWLGPTRLIDNVPVPPG